MNDNGSVKLKLLSDSSPEILKKKDDPDDSDSENNDKNSNFQIADQIEKLATQRDRKIITELEFTQLKQKLIAD